MLTRSQMYTLLSSKYSLFQSLPIELIKKIRDLPTPDTDFLIFLNNVIYGNYNRVKIRLDDSNPQDLMRLLVQAGNTVTRSGIQVQGKTPLECALGECDLDMVRLLIPYFSRFSGGIDECKSQMQRYVPCLESLKNQEVIIHEETTLLLNVIMKSLDKDILHELFTGKDYDWSHESEVRTQLIEFRNNKLNSACRMITTPRLHCDYLLVQSIYEVAATLEPSTIKTELFLRQVLGFTQLTEWSCYERMLYVKPRLNVIAQLEAIDGFHKNEFLQNFQINDINSRNGLGFTSYGTLMGNIPFKGPPEKTYFKDLYQGKISELLELLNSHLDIKREVISKSTP